MSKKLLKPIVALPKVGSRYKALLENLEIFTYKDLLYHMPFRYDDLSETKRINELIEGEKVTVQATLGPVENIFTRYGKKITKSYLIDHTGKLPIIWFNQHFLKKTLQPGAIYTVSGKVALIDRKVGMMSPDIEEYKEGSLNAGRLVPVYPETQGVSSKWIRARINDVLFEIGDLEDNIPEIIRNKFELKDLNWSLKQIHFPDGLEEAKMARYRLGFEELFIDLLNVEIKKEEWSIKLKTNSYKPYAKEVTKFISGLPFELTDSQKEAVNEISTDMQKAHPMNRLLEGDVGTGKTVVAIVSAYLSHLNGYKTVYLAPTEILAQQHFETFTKFLADTGLVIDLVTGSKKKISEKSDVVIGTHALLYNKNIFEYVGLVVIDEQQRFGVEQRGKITELSKQNEKFPHLLTMTATPIPRTLALTIFGDLALSTLKTHPKTARQVKTKVIPQSQRDDIYKWIKDKNMPTFVVCPLIEESFAESLGNVKAAEEEYNKLKETIFSPADIGLIHGRMNGKQKQEVIDDFRNGKLKVVVATPVIEVGIDIPDATIMVIESAERYGLASLHQLRGRIGRSGDKGYCFIFMSSYNSKSLERLKHLEEIDDGLKLAEIDMKLRGQGDMFTTMQHGFKRYKIANLDDFDLIEKAKKAAQLVFNDHKLRTETAAQIDLHLGSFITNN